MITEFLLGMMKNFRYSNYGYHNTVNIFSASKLYTYNWLKSSRSVVSDSLWLHGL